MAELAGAFVCLSDNLLDDTIGTGSQVASGDACSGAIGSRTPRTNRTILGRIQFHHRASLAVDNLPVVVVAFPALDNFDDSRRNRPDSSHCRKRFVSLDISTQVKEDSLASGANFSSLRFRYFVA